MTTALLSLNAFYFFYIIALGLYMFKKRVAAVKAKHVDHRYFKAYSGAISDELKVIENHFNNQFQAPVLFMITCIFAIQTKIDSQVITVFAALFVTSRMAHSLIHLTTNKVLQRAALYFFGLIMIGFMWLFILTQTPIP